MGVRLVNLTGGQTLVAIARNAEIADSEVDSDAELDAESDSESGEVDNGDLAPGAVAAEGSDQGEPADEGAEPAEDDDEDSGGELQ
jgi:hypothetical protein